MKSPKCISSQLNNLRAEFLKALIHPCSSTEARVAHSILNISQ